MKRFIGVLLLGMVALSATAKGRVETFTVKSALLGVEKVCSVYLPDGYDPAKRYPVLYLLHGASGTHRSWIDEGDMLRICDETIAEGKAVPMIVVMPDASGEGPRHNGFGMGYFNVEGWPYERFFFEEFMPAVEAHYPIRAERCYRAVAGLSMGGGGSAVYALRHPELFGASCPLSGALDSMAYNKKRHPAYMKAIADNYTMRVLREQSDEGRALVRTVRWWVDCGDDDYLYMGNIRFYMAFREQGIPIEFRMRDGGHTWRYWQTALPDVLTFISVGFANAAMAE
ncbi:MAG: esterase family protein [Alistipes sp.]|nr:esterase family protein [Alistipes sp.]